MGAVGHPSAAGYAIARPAGLGNTLRSYGYFALRAQYASAFVRALNRRARNARARCRSIPLPLVASLGRRSYQIKYGEQINHDDIYIMM